MKITNLSSKDSEQMIFKSENINGIQQGVTRRLIDKYKHKHICNTEATIDSKKRKKSGLRS